MTLTRAMLLALWLTGAQALSASAAQEWPFQRYSHARAYTYNFFASGSSAQWNSSKDGRIWSAAAGWSRYIRSTAMLGDAEAAAIAGMVRSTRGSFETSKCPFMPRHAVVYFDRKDEPIAGVEICFECGDVAVWPEYPGWRRLKLDWEKLEPIYNKALRDYGTLFSAKLNLPLNWKDDPQPPPR